MRHEGISITKDSFSKTIMNQIRNDTDMDKCIFKHEFMNPDIRYFEKTEFKIMLNDNLLLTKYANKIKASCSVKELSPSDKAKYNYRPEALSTDEYDTPNLWYVILFVNDCEDIMQFYDLNQVLIPDLSVILECLTYEEYINKKSRF